MLEAYDVFVDTPKPMQHELLPRYSPALPGAKPTDFYVTVHGDSLSDADIRDGDTLIMARGKEIQDGDIVAVRLDEVIHLKRMKFGDPSLLVPPAGDGEPIAVPDSQRRIVMGVLHSIQRRYKPG